MNPTDALIAMMKGKAKATKKKKEAKKRENLKH